METQYSTRYKSKMKIADEAYKKYPMYMHFVVAKCGRVFVFMDESKAAEKADALGENLLYSF